MSWPYAYTPYLWPVLVTAAPLLVLAAYAWRRRTVPAVIPFLLLVLVWELWAIGSALELAATDPQVKWFWFQCEATLKVATATLGLIFVLAYAGLEKWLTRRTLFLLTLAFAVAPLMIVTNPLHHLGWSSVSIGEHVVAKGGPIYWVLFLYSMALFLFQVGVLIWLWVRAPLYRWPVALMIGGQTLGRAAIIVEALGFNPFAPLDAGLFFSIPIVLVYFLALFRFRLFDVVPVGRDMAVERMVDGMIVLDAEDRVVDLNRAARHVLARRRRDSIGRPGQEVLSGFPDLLALLTRPAPAEGTVMIEGSGPPEYLQAHISPLVHSGGFRLGRLILLRDVTEQKQAQAQLLEQQRAVAALQEREHLGRELHDNLGQVLGYVKLKVHAAREALAQEQSAEVEHHLSQLETVVQEAHTDVRDYLLGVDHRALGGGNDFLASLGAYLARFQKAYQIETDLQVGPGLGDRRLDPTAQVQLLRIIQEALTNTRKHSGACRACVSFSTANGRARIVVEDDGSGFDPAQPRDGREQHYGLGFMRDRAAEVGGNVQIDSAPGRGTRVMVDLPFSA